MAWVIVLRVSEAFGVVRASAVDLIPSPHTFTRCVTGVCQRAGVIIIAACPDVGHKVTRRAGRSDADAIVACFAYASADPYEAPCVERAAICGAPRAQPTRAAISQRAG